MKAARNGPKAPTSEPIGAHMSPAMPAIAVESASIVVPSMLEEGPTPDGVGPRGSAPAWRAGGRVPPTHQGGLSAALRDLLDEAEEQKADSETGGDEDQTVEFRNHGPTLLNNRGERDACRHVYTPLQFFRELSDFAHPSIFSMR